MAKKKEEFKLDGYDELSPGVFQKRKVEPKDTATNGGLSFSKKDVSKSIDNILKGVYGDDYYCYEFPVDPMGKPRMTQQDKWRKRPATDRYWQLKDNLKKIADGYKFKMPECDYHMIFNLPMPDSWSKKKKEEFNGKPHQQKPDKDNLEKAVLDALCEEDSYIWDGRVSKYWAYKGSIIIKNIK